MHRRRERVLRVGREAASHGERRSAETAGLALEICVCFEDPNCCMGCESRFREGKWVPRLSKLLKDTVPFFFQERGFAQEGLVDILLSRGVPTERALDFLAGLEECAETERRLCVDVPEDLFYRTHRGKIAKTDERFYASFMYRRYGGVVLTHDSVLRGDCGEGGGLGKAGDMEDDVAERQGRCQEFVAGGPFLAGLAPGMPSGDDSVHGSATCRNWAGAGGNGEGSGPAPDVHRILDGVLTSERCGPLLQSLKSCLESRYFSDTELVELCNYVFAAGKGQGRKASSRILYGP